MDVRDAQREVRNVYIGGFVGQLVSGLLWLLSAAAATWMTPRRGIAVLILGGFFIFPVTQAVLRAMKRPASLKRENPMSQLAMQVAFTFPLNLPLVAAATLHRLDWFYPACMIALGAHYLPFTFLYGLWQFAVLCAVLVAAGILIGLCLPGAFATGAWFTAAALLAFAFEGRAAALRDRGRPGA
jgi:hypothetical protein